MSSPKPDPETVVPEGHYARKQVSCKSRLIAWSHTARFRLAGSLAGAHPGEKLLDYGCGDGTFLAMVAGRFAACVGADIGTYQLDDCRRRFQAVPNVRFCTVADLTGAEHTRAYRVVTCMETLEHCLPPVVTHVLEDLNRLVMPGGTILISVPIEIGPTFLLKYAIRKVAAWRGLSDYRYYERYSVRDALKMLFATSDTFIDRPAYGEPGQETYSHYGFNWRAMRQRVAESLVLERTLFSPLGFPGGFLSSQAWFVCRSRQESGVRGQGSGVRGQKVDETAPDL